MLLLIGIVHFSLGEEIGHFKEIQSQKKQKTSAEAKEKDFYITPRGGFSPFTGLIGIELQYKHFAFDIGYATFGYTHREGEGIQQFLAYGIKYYVNPHKRTVYVGVGSWTELTKGQDPQDETYPITFIFGYRWRWKTGWDFNLGIGAIFNGEGYPPMVELAFGYSF
jgi:hypothetical protein